MFMGAILLFLPKPQPSGHNVVRRSASQVPTILLLFLRRPHDAERRATFSHQPTYSSAGSGSLWRSGLGAASSSGWATGDATLRGWGAFSTCTAQNFSSGCLATRPIALMVKSFAALPSLYKSPQ